MTELSSFSLEVDRVCKSFVSGDHRLNVLTDVSLSLCAGDSLAIVGPSGSGKSTLLQIIGTLDRPDSGSVIFENVANDGQSRKVNPFSLEDKQLAELRNQSVGFIFQDHHLLPQLTVLENVLVPCLAFGNSSDANVEHALALIESVGLTDRVDHLPGQLSGGQRERVAIARALVMSPSIILADEPTGNLDRTTAQEMTELMLHLQHSTHSILITVTHSEDLASAMGKQCELVDGKLA
ncbi:Lipoprotein-releasing system ATP-binding protein LolD [Rubripirellula amarantea]|uniref:Lipoprotein-releasing system ATP-binding protein LolD n=1 Tax=Rubripirellula amarantea TaxID=2527999 RepID=A0A5C5WSG3_9BACT|nr:ABC transporter ATP-binding protein [Rubripirellula amarantea]TWT53557.1 Lipoprotein-releasing system ATP-binding protein LolD [Rubripirellula amarantea]